MEDDGEIQPVVSVRESIVAERRPATFSDALRLVLTVFCLTVLLGLAWVGRL